MPDSSSSGRAVISPTSADAFRSRVSTHCGIAGDPLSEALQNVTKHTDDARAHVLAVHDGGRLVIEVSDDGPGGASAQAGTGLRGLTDRVAAVGGTLQITSPCGGGTSIRAEIPCGS